MDKEPYVLCYEGNSLAQKKKEKKIPRAKKKIKDNFDCLKNEY